MRRWYLARRQRTRGQWARAVQCRRQGWQKEWCEPGGKERGSQQSNGANDGRGTHLSPFHELYIFLHLPMEHDHTSMAAEAAPGFGCLSALELPPLPPACFNRCRSLTCGGNATSAVCLSAILGDDRIRSWVELHAKVRQKHGGITLCSGVLHGGRDQDKRHAMQNACVLVSSCVCALRRGPQCRGQVTG